MSFGLAEVIVGVVALLVTLWLGYRALLPPKRELLLTAVPPAPLLAEASAGLSDLRVALAGQLVSDPYVATLSIANTGRFDISEASFDGQRPLVISLGADPVAVLRVSSSPSRGTDIPVVLDGQEVQIGPGLISRRQQVDIQVLTSGRPTLDALESATRHDLVDVDVDFKRRLDPDRRAALVGAMTGLVATLVAGGVLATVFDRFFDDGEVTLSPASGRPGTVATFKGKGFDKFAVIRAKLDSAGGTIAAGQADADGRFTISGRIPTSVPRGALDITVKAISSGGTDYNYLTFYVTR